MDKKILLDNVNESIDNGPIGFCNCYADIIYVNSSNISTCSCIFTFWYSNMIFVDNDEILSSLLNRRSVGP